MGKECCELCGGKGLTSPLTDRSAGNKYVEKSCPSCGIKMWIEDNYLEISGDPEGITKDLESAAESMNLNADKNNQNNILPTWLPTVAFSIGIAFITLIVVLVSIYPNPTEAHFFMFRIVLALSGAAFSSALTSFIAIKQG